MQFWDNIKSVIEYSFFAADWIRLVCAVLAILLAIVLRQFFARVVVDWLKKAAGESRMSMDSGIIYAVENPVRLLIIVLGIWAAVTIMDFPDKSQEFLERILRSLVAFSIFKAAYRVSDIATAVLQKITRKSQTKIDDMLLHFIRKSMKALIVVMGTVTIVQEWYDNIGGLLAGLGLGGLAFALAARDTVANLFGSITIMMDRPFRIGDWITTPHADGTVEEIGFRSTRIRTFTQAVITIPNSVMSNDPITNWSKMGKRRVSFKIGLKYGTQPEKIREFINFFRELLCSNPGIHPETVVVSLDKLGESALEILFYFFTSPTDWLSYMEVLESVNFAIIGKLDEMGLEIAYPARSVYVENSASD